MTSYREDTTAMREARKRDAVDPLRHFRGEFQFPKNPDGTDQIYFCGNSLGLQHQSVHEALDEVLASWSSQAVSGHFTGERPWMHYHELLREGQAQLLGAHPTEVVTMNTLTVNLHLAMVSFYRPAGNRRRILIEKQAFPSDRYAVESQIRFHGLDPADCLVELSPPSNARNMGEELIETYLREHGDEVALVLWPGVQYASGQVFNLQRIAEWAREAGACVGFDLAHAAGNVPLALHDTGCDFAAWCTYKYLNAGPGAVAGMFVHSRHGQSLNLPRFHGWWGNEVSSRFQMDSEFRPAQGADAWQLSNPPILAMAPLLTSLETFARAGFIRMRQKSLEMTGWLAERVVTELNDILEIITPLQPEQRGCQLSLRVRAGRDQGRSLFTNLQQQGFVPDWREPDVIRVAPVPLYNNFEDCERLVHAVQTWAVHHTRA